MREINPVLHIGDIKSIFGVSQPTVYRWLADARAGKSLFPLPLGGHKQKLCWSRESIEAFMQPKNVPQPANIASPMKQKQKNKTLQQRQEAIQRGMERHGITNHYNQ